VQGGDTQTVVFEVLTDTIHSRSSSTEDDAAAAFADSLGSDFSFHRASYHPEEVLHVVHADLLWSDLDFHRVMEVASYQVVHLIIQCRTEEDCLALWIAMVENIANRLHESHVRHAVSLIDDDYVNILQAEGTFLHQVDQTTWASDDDVYAALESANLRYIRCAAVDRQNIKIDLRSERSEHGVDLYGQLTRWS
jgi:hypothetical protein